MTYLFPVIIHTFEIHVISFPITQNTNQLNIGNMIKYVVIHTIVTNTVKMFSENV